VTIDMTKAAPTADIARSLAPLLAARRDAAETAACLDAEVDRAFADARLYLLVAPREYGGHEASIAEVIETVEALAVGDPGAAWHVANSVVAGVLGGCTDPDAARQLYAGPPRHFGFSAVPGGTATADPDRGGYRIEGRWPFVTGARSTGWVGLTAIVVGADPPQARTFFVPASEVTVEDTWRGMLGMMSSGSHAVSASDAHSPAGLSFSFVDPQPRLARPMFLARPYLVFAATGIGVVLGVWQAALEATIAAVGGKRSSMDGSLQAELSSVQLAVAEAYADLTAFRSGLLAESAAMWDRLSIAGHVTPAERAPLWALLLRTPATARESISRLYAASSTLAWPADHPVARAVRDIHSITVAFERFSKAMADAGRAMTGLEPLMPPF